MSSPTATSSTSNSTSDGRRQRLRGFQPTPAPHPLAAGLAAREALIAAVKNALRSGDAARARTLMAEPLRRRPDDPVMLSFAGLAHRMLGDTLGAIELLERAVRLAPDLPPTRLALAETLIEAYRAPRALAMLDALPANAQRSSGVLLARAAALGALGDQLGEVVVLRDLARIESSNAAMRLSLGHALRALGDADAALAEYRAVLGDHPANGAAWWSIANMQSARFDSADETAMRALLATPALGDDDRVRIGFALARAAEVAGSDATAFALYAEANALRHRQSPFDRGKFDRHFDAASALFTAEFFAQRPGHGCRSDAPIFIVGMQRSGSTLLEQMLSSHPGIEGTAELPHINQLVREVQRDARLVGQRFEQRLASLDAGATRALGEEYLARAAPHRQSDRPIFLDKTPNNWAHAGFIRLILPKARLIDMRRHPMACGFSNFRQLYASGIEHSYSLAEWAHHYRAYLGFMEPIEVAQPGWVGHVAYEALIDDPERELGRLCDHLGVAFDPVMLDFHRNRRAVRTISAEQVRQPLHRGALDEWRRFEPWLDPLREALGPAIDQWDDQSAEGDA